MEAETKLELLLLDVDVDLIDQLLDHPAPDPPSDTLACGSPFCNYSAPAET